MIKASYILMFFLLPYFHASSTDQIKALAFPGAEGAGKYTSGGRGGKIFIVSNLNDSGKGSLREALEQKGARMVVFDISGTINLKKELIIKHGDVTIAGQSAPGDGICLKGYPLILDSDNIIIRYIRIRLGDISGEPFDAISSIGNKNIIVDHCSFSWAIDECASFYDNENFTLQWSIISESLNNSVHPKGEHGYGGIWGGNQASFHHNILAHHTSRLPRFQGSRNNKNPELEKVEFSNNIIYNWKNQCAYGGEEGNYNLIKNIFVPGPATNLKEQEEILKPYKPYGNFYLDGNYILTKNNNQLNWKKYTPTSEDVLKNQLHTSIQIYEKTKTEDAQNAYTKILNEAGVSLNRDEVDSRIINEVENITHHFGAFGIIDSQTQVGGWPVLKNDKPKLDGDKDGMPDEWEVKNNLNPSEKMDYNGYNLSKTYTNIEIYLNSIVEYEINM